MVYEYERWSRLPTNEGRRDYDSGGNHRRGGGDYSRSRSSSRWDEKREDVFSSRGRHEDHHEDRRGGSGRERDRDDSSRSRNWDVAPVQREEEFSRSVGRADDEVDFGGGWAVNARDGERPEVILPEDLGLPGGFTDKQVIITGRAKLCADNQRVQNFIRQPMRSR